MSSIVPMTFANLSPQIATLRHLHKRWISRTPPPRAAHPGTPARSPLDPPGCGGRRGWRHKPRASPGAGLVLSLLSLPRQRPNVHRRPRQHRSEGGPERHGEHGARWERSPTRQRSGPGVPSPDSEQPERSGGRAGFKRLPCRVCFPGQAGAGAWSPRLGLIAEFKPTPGRRRGPGEDGKDSHVFLRSST